MGIHTVPATPISANWPTKNDVDIIGAESLAEAFGARHFDDVAVLSAAERGGPSGRIPLGGSGAVGRRSAGRALH